MRNRMVSLSAMVTLVGIMLLGVVRASSSAGTLPGQSASPELMEGTTARVLGFCVNSGTPCAVTTGGGTYCETTYGDPLGGGCTAGGGATRVCGNCAGGNHVSCVANTFVSTRCCTWTDDCCTNNTECKTNAGGCNCVAVGVPPAPYGTKTSCFTGAGPNPCTP